MGTYLNPGKQSFQMAVQSEIFVDKSDMILYLNTVVNTQQRYVSISRPRRFGKTMAADMICAYYDRTADSRQLFESRKLAEVQTAEGKLPWDAYLGKFDVIRLVMTKFIKRNKTVTEALNDLQRLVVRDIQKAYPNQDYFNDQDLIQTKGTTVAAETTKENVSSVYLCGGTSYEKNLFAACVQEFFADINDQRYILVKKRNRKGDDGFYSVPECFAKRKEDAENFMSCVTPYIGEYELVYTRNGKGKELLLEGRVRSLEKGGSASTTHKVVREA